jgi:hypothetical protein
MLKPQLFTPTQSVELFEEPYGRYEVDSTEPPDEKGVQILFIVDSVGGVLCTNRQVRLIEK